MKPNFNILAAALLLAIASVPALAQQTSGQPMQNMPMHDMGKMPMQDMPGMKGMMHSNQASAEGTGVVEAVDTAKGTVTIKHQAIASIHWPAMTMTFKAAKPELLKGVKVGEKVQFGLHVNGMQGTVTWIKPAQS